MDAASREKGMPDEQMVALFGSLGFKDYAPEPEPYYQRLLEWLEEPIQ
jgi:effector-binding domain-containing protein